MSESSSPVPTNRRKSALVRVAQKRQSLSPVVNLNCLVRVYLLDGSSKLLQMFENSTAQDVLISLKFNLDLDDISTYALFRVAGHMVRRIELNEKVTSVLRDSTESGQEVRLLFRSWISYKYGGYEKEVFQDDVIIKQPNTALWLAYMEATFMCMTGKYYLTEEESLLLGCLKMQAESGDFNPAVHSLKVMKNRIESRFPNPIRSRMKALNSPTLSGTGAGDDLAIRAQALYARIAGKLKLDAQIDFLNSLRMWCPFYGCTFFEVQCQYDYSPLDSTSTPPVLMMTAAIGPLALFLITTSDPPVIMRHPYKRIIKWIAHPDKHIFTYWVIKAEVTLSDIEDMQQQHSGNGDFDARPYCDCVYLVTSQVKELEYLVQSYVASRRRVSPHLPGAPDELKDIAPEPSPRTSEEATSIGNSTAADITAPQTGTSKSPPPPPSAQPAYPAMQRRASRLGVFLSALGGTNGGSGSGLTEEEHVVEDHFGDDTAAVNNSLFKNMYKAPTGTRRGGKGGNDSESEDEDATLKQIPAGIKYASTMSELQKVASETNFSDEEGSEGEEDDDEASSDDEEGGSSRAKKGHIKGASNGRSPKRNPDSNAARPSSSKHVPPPPPPPQRRASLLSQASGMLFGNRGNKEDVDSEESGGDSDSSGDNLQRKKKGRSRSKKRQDSDEECD